MSLQQSSFLLQFAKKKKKILVHYAKYVDQVLNAGQQKSPPFPFDGICELNDTTKAKCSAETYGYNVISTATSFCL